MSAVIAAVVTAASCAVSSPDKDTHHTDAVTSVWVESTKHTKGPLVVLSDEFLTTTKDMTDDHPCSNDAYFDSLDQAYTITYDTEAIQQTDQVTQKQLMAEAIETCQIDYSSIKKAGCTVSSSPLRLDAEPRSLDFISVSETHFPADYREHTGQHPAKAAKDIYDILAMSCISEALWDTADALKAADFPDSLSLPHVIGAWESVCGTKYAVSQNSSIQTDFTEFKNSPVFVMLKNSDVTEGQIYSQAMNSYAKYNVPCDSVVRPDR